MAQRRRARTPRDGGAVPVVAVLALLCGSAGSAPTLELKVDQQTGAFHIALEGEARREAWFSGTEYAVGALSSSAGSLVLAGSQNASGKDALGEFQATAFSWASKRSPSEVLMQTSFRQYKGEADFVVFEQRFPRELNLTELVEGSGIGTLFPSFGTVGPHGGDDPCFAFHGVFAKCRACTVKTYQPTDQGVPFVVYDPSRPELPMAVLSPLDNPMATTMYRNGGTYGMGVRPAIDIVPGGWQQSFILSAGQGVNDGMMRWGDLMLRFQGVQRLDNRYRDDIHGGIGFWTDNGGFYHYSIGANKSLGSNYEEVLQQVKAYHDGIGVPFRHWQFDSWFYPKDGVPAHGGGGPGVTNWTSMPSVFPRGMAYIQSKLRLPMVMHNRQFSPINDYIKHWTDIEWYVEEHISFPKDPARFFERFFQQQRGWGLGMYEQDWMVTQFSDTKALQTNISLGDLWLRGMATGAEGAKLTVQYCMPLPNQVLASAALPVVTNIRATWDYQPGDENTPQWSIGNNAMLLWALNKLPFKDGFYSSSLRQVGGEYQGPETRPNREALIATLSCAMVGPMDGIYLLNVSRVMAACRADGVVLKPDRPITTPDACFRRRDPICNIFTTHSSVEGVGLVRYYFGNNGSAPVLAEELGVDPSDPARRYAVYNWYARSVAPLQASNPVRAGYEGHIYAVVAEAVQGWVFIGEVSSLWTGGDSEQWALSSDSGEEDEEAVGAQRRRPPTTAISTPPGPLDGHWVLCSPKGRQSAWLDTITIAGPVVTDGCGNTCRLVATPRGPSLCGGLLARRGAALIRMGKTGGVQVYLRQASGADGPPRAR